MVFLIEGPLQRVIVLVYGRGEGAVSLNVAVAEVTRDVEAAVDSGWYGEAAVDVGLAEDCLMEAPGVAGGCGFGGRVECGGRHG